MFYKIFFQILLITAVISVICISAIKPQMHKSVLIYNSDYNIKIVDDEPVNEDEIPSISQTVTVLPKQINVKEATVSDVMSNVNQAKRSAEPSTFHRQTKKQVDQSTSKQEQKVVKNEHTIPEALQELTTKKTETVQSSAPVENTGNNYTETKTIKKTIPVPKPTVNQKQVNPQPKVLTPQEEEIAWNIWRSNLQNKIMRDVKLPVLPNGTIFKFKFSVDKYGKVSNVQTWSPTPAYTPYAIQYIAPVIRSYQGHSILNFPTGSNRVTTEVNGSWKLSPTEKFSTPLDYNDVEKKIIK